MPLLFRFRFLMVATILLSSLPALSAKKVLYVDSYHEGFAWSDGITAGVKKVLSPAGCELKIFRMDTKRNPSDEYKQKIAQTAFDLVQSFAPDVIIASDDNASKYLLVPYLKNGAIPCVFCGINWDAGAYGFPCKNITGMVEVASVDILILHLQPFAKGKKVGLIGPNNESHEKETVYQSKTIGRPITDYPVESFDDWKLKYAVAQKEVDVLLIENTVGIPHWNDSEALAFIYKNTTIPTGTNHEFMAQFALVGASKSAEEQGTWAAETALKIIGGAQVSAIPVAKNKQVELYLNQKMADILKVQFTPAQIKMAEMVLK